MSNDQERIERAVGEISRAMYSKPSEFVGNIKAILARLVEETRREALKAVFDDDFPMPESGSRSVEVNITEVRRGEISPDEPNATTRAAMDAIERGEVVTATSYDDLIIRLDAPDDPPAPDDGERCQRCGSAYSDVWRAPDDLWQAVTGRTDGGGLYCPRCFTALGRERGIEVYWDACRAESWDSPPTPEADEPYPAKAVYDGVTVNITSIERGTIPPIDDLPTPPTPEGQEGTVCVWVYDDHPDWPSYESSCGEAWYLNEGTPEENHYRFCPGCGKPIKTQHPEPEEDEDKAPPLPPKGIEV